MSDPAVAAAQRAWEAVHPHGSVTLAAKAYGDDAAASIVIAAAREALKPIRELHAPHWSNCINACCSGEQCKHRSRLCGGCDEYWPCATARLVYAEEELS
jgi:hypothetical protein